MLEAISFLGKPIFLFFAVGIPVVWLWRRGGHPKLVPAPDLLQRDFTADRSDLRRVADITEFAGRQAVPGRDS